MKKKKRKMKAGDITLRLGPKLEFSKRISSFFTVKLFDDVFLLCSI